MERTLDELAAAGLAEFRRPCLRDFADHGHEVPEAVTGMWVVFPTPASQVVGLLLARSPELVQLMDLAARMALVGCNWAGVNMRRIVREFDLREGGTGEIADWGAWLRERDRQQLATLPRREGLDGDQPPAEEPEERHSA
jgi:hypothetical protein